MLEQEVYGLFFKSESKVCGSSIPQTESSQSNGGTE